MNFKAILFLVILGTFVSNKQERDTLYLKSAQL